MGDIIGEIERSELWQRFVKAHPKARVWRDKDGDTCVSGGVDLDDGTGSWLSSRARNTLESTVAGILCEIDIQLDIEEHGDTCTECHRTYDWRGVCCE